MIPESQYRGTFTIYVGPPVGWQIYVKSMQQIKNGASVNIRTTSQLARVVPGPTFYYFPIYLHPDAPTKTDLSLNFYIRLCPRSHGCVSENIRFLKSFFSQNAQ